MNMNEVMWSAFSTYKNALLLYKLKNIPWIYLYFLAFSFEGNIGRSTPVAGQLHICMIY